MDHFVGRNAAGDLDQFMVVGRGQHADIAVGRAEFEFHDQLSASFCDLRSAMSRSFL